mgnify:CR=1 FL=1
MKEDLYSGTIILFSATLIPVKDDISFYLGLAIPAILGYNTLMRSNKTNIKKMQRFARQLHAYFLTGRATKHSSGVM